MMPAHCFPHSKIDQLADSTNGDSYLIFMDAYTGFHKIPMAKQDQTYNLHYTPRVVLL